MDEGGGLENRYTGDCIVGSNPTPSARYCSNNVLGSLTKSCWSIYSSLNSPN